MKKLNEFISIFANIAMENVVKHGRKYYDVSPELQVMSDNISSDLFSIGVFLGEDSGNFIPSLALLEILARQSTRKVFLNKKSEWLFLCGRDVFEQGIIRKNVDDGLVLVQNEHDENLGYGRLYQKGKDLFVKNILDRGDFLRRES